MAGSLYAADDGNVVVVMAPGTDSVENRVERLEGKVDGRRSDVDGLRGDVVVLRADVNELRVDVNGLRADVNGLRVDVNGLRAEMREGDEETRRYMRVLHEDLVDRIKTIGESTNGRPRRPRRRTK